MLEIGCGAGASADYLAGHGADRVVSLDADGAAVERARVRYPRPRLEFRAVTDLRALSLSSLTVGAAADGFDLVLVPDGQAVLSDPEMVTALKRMLRDDSGYLVVAAPSADRRSPAFAQGLGYYDVADALAPHFPQVRMLGQTPFFGFGLVEFDGSADALRVDASLVDGGTEAPSHYVGVAGASPTPPLGYALVQIPAAPVEARLVAGEPPAGTPPGRVEELSAEIARLTGQLESARPRERGVDASAAEARAELAERRLDEAERRARTRSDEADTRLGDLRRKLEEALIQSESAVRVARAQGDEMEELRGRLRRAADDRAAADAELAKLRRALAEADDAVLALTRRTAEEMALVAQRMATGLRAAGALPPVTVGAAGAAGAEADGRRHDKDARDRSGEPSKAPRELAKAPRELAEAPAELAEAPAELAEAREEAERLRVRLEEAEARAAAAERRLEEVATARRAQQAAISRAAAPGMLPGSTSAASAAAAVTTAAPAGASVTTGSAPDVAGIAAGGVATRNPEAEELEARLRRAEEEAARQRTEAAALTQRLRVAEEQARALRERAAAVTERDDRIARLEGDKQDLIWRVAELEEKLRHAESDGQSRRSASEELASARGARDRAIEQFHRAAAAHVNEVNRLQASVGEQAALVAELEDALRMAEARAAAAEKDAATLRRGAKELEEADRTRRGRLAELEGKLLRLEREKAMAATAAPSAGGAGSHGAGAGAVSAEAAQQLQALEQRAVAAEQRALAAEEARAATLREAAALRQKLEQSDGTATDTEDALWRAKEQILAGSARIGMLEQELEAARASTRATTTTGHNGTNGGGSAGGVGNVGNVGSVGNVGNVGNVGMTAGPPAAEVIAAIEEIEERLREEVRTLAVVEETLARAREEAARAAARTGGAGGAVNVGAGAGAAGERGELERSLAARDAQLAEGRLELARIRRDAEAREAALSREIAELRARLHGGGSPTAPDDYSTQLILMHTTLGNIRRRAARLRDELEGFRRRLDTLPPGALSSMLEEIGEDLAEFAK